jgi:ribose transport system substrate-binding protein
MTIYGTRVSSGVLVTIALFSGAAPAVAAEQPSWCKVIANGIYCAPPEEHPPTFCGTKEISIALADGFAANPWRQQTTATAINEASRCPNIKSWTHTDGQGNTQKAISDIQGLVAKGVDAIVVLADAGPAMLPTIRDAYKQGVTVVPYRAKVGGKEGVDYTVFVGTNFYQHGVEWSKWMGTALGGKGNVAYLGGPPGASESLEKSAGIKEGLKDFPDIKRIGQDPYDVTNWDPSMVAQATTGLIAQYPTIDGLFADMTISVLTSGAFPRADRNLPLLAGQDSNGFGCKWKEQKEKDGKATFEFMTTSAEHWNVRLAIEWAIASAAGGKIDKPIVVRDNHGGEHVVANPGEKLVTNFVMDNSLNGVVFCDPRLPEAASNGNSLTIEQTVQALKGGI